MNGITIFVDLGSDPVRHAGLIVVLVEIESHVYLLQCLLALEFPVDLVLLLAILFQLVLLLLVSDDELSPVVSELGAKHILHLVIIIIADITH